MGAEHTLCPSCGSVQSEKLIFKVYNSDRLVHVHICNSCGVLYVDSILEKAKDRLKNTLASVYGVPDILIGD
jgi:uncharacterized Zn finger protein